MTRKRSLVSRVARKLAHPSELRAFLRYKFSYGNEYLYFDLVDRVPLAGELVHRSIPPRVDLEQPLFLAGLRRSGTTLFYRIMHSHPDLFLYNEKFPGVMMNYHREPEVTAHWDNIWRIDDPDRFRKAVWRYIGPVVRRRYRRWGVKLAMELAHPNSGSPSVPDVLKLFEFLPGAKVIGIVRDPRDFAVSASRRGGHDVAWWIEEYTAMIDLFRELRQREAARFTVIRYEDLVIDAPKVIAECCAFAGIPFRDEMLHPSGWSGKGPEDYDNQAIVPQIEKWRRAEGSDLEVVRQVQKSLFPRASEVGYRG